MERGNLFLMKGIKKGVYIYNEKKGGPKGEGGEKTKQNISYYKAFISHFEAFAFQ